MLWIVAGNVIYDVALVISSVVVIWYGGTGERWGIVIVLVGGGLTALMPAVRHTIGPAVRYGYLAIEIGALMGFDAIMMRSRRYWPIWATGAQVAAVILAVAVALSPDHLPPYRLIQGKFAYILLLSMVLGSLPGRNELQRSGARSDG